MLTVACDSENLPRTVSVSGQGVVSAPPDTATINSGVVSTASTAEQALRSNNEAVRALLEVLSTQNITNQDIQTSFFSVNPQFDRNPDGSRGPITGYQVTNDLRVIVRDLDRLGIVLDALVDAGSNTISGVGFSIENSQQLMDRAQGIAVENATKRALILAEAAELTLGPLIAISEQPVSVPTSALLSEARSSVPVATGALDITATVSLQFKLS